MKGYTVADAIQRFLNDPNHPDWLVDDGPWPTNAGCNGIAKFSSSFYLRKEKKIAEN